MGMFLSEFAIRQPIALISSCRRAVWVKRSPGPPIAGWSIRLSEPAPNQRDSNLWVQQVDTRAGKLIGEAKRLTSGPDVKTGLSFTADGKRLTFLRRSGEPHLYISQVAADQDHLTAPRRLSLEEGRNLPYTWTADSKSLVFISDREGPFHLFKQGIDQAAPDLLVDGSNMVMIARLNPDGSEILYLLTPDANDPSRPSARDAHASERGHATIAIARTVDGKHTVRAYAPPNCACLAAMRRTPSAFLVLTRKLARSAN